MKIVSPEEFREILSSGKKFSLPELTIKYKKRNQVDPRLGLVVSKKKFLSAVARNFLKRKAREAFRLMQAELPPWDYLVLFQDKALEARAQDLTKLLERAFRDLGKDVAKA